MRWHGSLRGLYFLAMANVNGQHLQLQYSLYMEHFPFPPQIKATMYFKALLMVSTPVMSEAKPQLFYSRLRKKLCE